MSEKLTPSRQYRRIPVATLDGVAVLVVVALWGWSVQDMTRVRGGLLLLSGLRILRLGRKAVVVHLNYGMCLNDTADMEVMFALKAGYS